MWIYYGAKNPRLSLNFIQLGWMLCLHLMIHSLSICPAYCENEAPGANRIIAPTKGEILTIGTNYDIKWNGLHTIGMNLTLHKINNELGWAMLDRLENDYSFKWDWYIGEALEEGYYQVKIRDDYSRGLISDAFILQMPLEPKPNNHGAISYEALVYSSTETVVLAQQSVYLDGSKSREEFVELTVTTTRTILSTSFLAVIQSTNVIQTTETSIVFSPTPSIQDDPIEPNPTPVDEQRKSSLPSDEASSQKPAIGVIIGAVLSGVGFLAVAAAIVMIWLIRKRNRKRNGFSDHPPPDVNTKYPFAGTQILRRTVGARFLGLKSRIKEEDLTPRGAGNGKPPDNAEYRVETVSEDAEYFPNTRPMY